MAMHNIVNLMKRQSPSVFLFFPICSPIPAKLHLYCVLLFHALTQYGNLLLNLNPQWQLIQVRIILRRLVQHLDPIVLCQIHRHNHGIILFVILIIIIIITSASRNSKQSCYKCLLHVRKAKIVCDFCNGAAEFVGEADGLVVGQFLLPELAVGDALVVVWVWEQILSVETRRAFLS